MGIITFEVHLITPTSPRNTLQLYLKAFVSFFFFIFLLSTMKHSMNGHIRERKENTIVFLFIQHPFLAMKVLHLTEHNFYELHIGVYN